LNVLHAWWPGGLIIGGLLGYFMNQANLSWKVQMGIILIPTLIYGFLIFGQQFPLTERVAAGISTGDMFKAASNPVFLLLMGCMMITASIELAPGQMVASVLGNLAKMSGILILVYGSALMFVLRYFAGTLAHLLSPIGMMFASVILAAIGLFMLANVSSTPGAYLAATVFYVGVCFMWPTMLGITSERFPEGGALAMGLMGFVGQFALGLVIFKMGGIRDKLKVGAGWSETADQATKSAAEAAADGAAFRYVAILAIVPAIVFGLWWLKDRAAGGYKAVKLSES
ncbi:MAG: MFS transporter, partial [Acidobacteria bacterium]|nr:MFS transporter [Acidobacteriota bacterium]